MDETHKVSNPSSIDQQNLDDLTITAYIYPGKYNSVELGYKTFFVDLPRAETMVKQLKLIRKRLAAIAKQMGATSDVYQSIGRICAAINAKHIIQETYHGGNFYSDCEFNFWDIPSGLRYLERKVEETQRVNGITEAA